jgi:hypothetical protein
MHLRSSEIGAATFLSKSEAISYCIKLVSRTRNRNLLVVTELSMPFCPRKNNPTPPRPVA